jgi:dTDP-4-dehydro-6-deoxy-alpha-D-glucopyranose 2,3-dehydratase
MSILRTGEELRAFLQRTLDQAGFELKPIPLAAQEDWGFKDGVLAHKSRGFFEVVGVEDSTGEKLMLYQPQSAVTGLTLAKDADTWYVLLQARVEPGNTGVGQYGPTVQSTPANFYRVHGGKKSDGMDWYLHQVPGSRMIHSSMQLDLGKRYLLKSKWHNYVILDKLVAAPPFMAWVSLPAIFSVLAYSNFFNADLRSLLAVFDWEHFIDGKTRALVRHDLAPLEYRYHNHAMRPSHFDMVPIEKLRQWSCTDRGIEPRDEATLNVLLYQVRSITREVKAWTQPLMKANGAGQVILYMRKTNREPEFLVSVFFETGITGQAVIGPSRLHYPGEATGTDKLSGTVWRAFWQCDEGGRFLQHDSLYQIIEVDPGFPTADHEFWVTVGGLKHILASSNVAAFQLRCISSALLDVLHSELGLPASE